MCLSSAKLRPSWELNSQHKQLGHAQDTAETESKLEGGPIPERPGMDIIGHYQLQRCPHRTVFTEIRSQRQQQQLGRTASGGQGSAGGFCSAHSTPWCCAPSGTSGGRQGQGQRRLTFSCPSSIPEAASEPPGLENGDLEQVTAPPGPQFSCL